MLALHEAYRTGDTIEVKHVESTLDKCRAGAVVDPEEPAIFATFAVAFTVKDIVEKGLDISPLKATACVRLQNDDECVHPHPQDDEFEELDSDRGADNKQGPAEELQALKAAAEMETTTLQQLVAASAAKVLIPLKEDSMKLREEVCRLTDQCVKDSGTIQNLEENLSDLMSKMGAMNARMDALGKQLLADKEARLQARQILLQAAETLQDQRIIWCVS